MASLLAANVDRLIAFLTGGAIALVLLLLANWLVPAEGRARVRQPTVYLALSVLAFALTWLFEPTSSSGRVFQFFYTFLLLASIGRSLVLLAVDVVFGRRTHRAPPRIFRDVTQAVAYVIVLLLTLRAIGVEPSSLLTTSALLTAVVGLALQDTLGNMVSGLALQMQRPFEVGDWIQFEQDPRQVGKVTEVNWRATTVVTNDLIEIIVPNAMLAKAPIRNYTRPTTVSRRTITIQGAYGVPPKRVHDAIAVAIGGTPGVLDEPKPLIQTRNFGDFGIEYAVHYFTDDFAARDITDALVRDRVWYALQRAEITVPFPTRTVHMHQISEESEKRADLRELERRDQVLRYVDFLDVLPPESHRALAAAAKVRLYSPGEQIVAQGDASTELFIIDRGDVIVELSKDGKPILVARLGPRRFFGEMGLMTGEVRKASVRAYTECELLVVSHDAFQASLASQPGVIEKMTELLLARQAELDAVSSSRGAQTEPMQERSRRLISQIKDFFRI